MPAPVAGGAPAQGQTGAAGANPFWEVTNLFAQPNKQGAVLNQLLGAATIPGGGQINPGNYLRGVRLVVRSAGATTGTPTQDNPFNVFQNLGMQNTDGAEILYNVISGYAYAQRQRFMRPWLQDIMTAYDFAQSLNPSFTIFLQPEVRQQLGVLENTDTRSQYSWTQTLNTAAALGCTGTAPTVNVTPYVDMWAQPDEADLEKVPNQRIPPGANLQTKTRHQTFALNAAGSGNSFLSTLQGNAVRCMLLIVRNSLGGRVDYLTNPIMWTQDQRSLGSLHPDNVFQWAADQYSGYGTRAARPIGIYPFPRFFNPGELYGQGWLYTANSTALQWESTTLGTGINLPGTVELLQEEVYAVGAIDPSLIDI
jgi:hypothetical protein